MKHLKFLSLCGIVAMAVSLFTLTACGGDDDDSPKPQDQGQTNNNGNNNGNNGNLPQINPELVIGLWSTVYANVSYVDEAGRQLSHNGPVDPTKEEDWPFYNVFYFGADGSFVGCAINYNGDGEYYGRFEETQIGKYRFDPATNTTTLYDLVMGYHEVLAYKNGQTVPTTEMSIKVQSLTEDELVCSIDGLGTYKMKKEEERTDVLPQINYAYLEGVWALVHKKGSDGEHTYDKDFPTAGNDGYEELVFGSTNTVEHWKQSGEQWICDVSGAYTRTGDVITLGEMTIKVLTLTKDVLVLDMGDEIITARKIELEGVWALVHKKGSDGEHNYDKDFPTAGNDGYEELVFGPANTVQHWAQKKGQWSCDVEGTYTRTGDVITLGEMNITILKLKLTNLVLDMGDEIITARKLTQSAYK